MTRVAQDPRYFTYLTDAPEPPRVVLGDARLSLEDEPAGQFDLVLLDAFSSDSIPVHLITTEAIGIEWKTVRPGGIIGFNISNRFYDLTGPITAGAEAAGLTVMVRAHEPTDAEREAGATPSRWLAASDDPAVIAQLEERGWTRAQAADHPFTDDYSDLIRYLQLGG